MLKALKIRVARLGLEFIVIRFMALNRYGSCILDYGYNSIFRVLER